MVQIIFLKNYEAFINPFVSLFENRDKWIFNYCREENDIEDIFLMMKTKNEKYKS